MGHRRKHHRAYGCVWDESQSSPTLERIGQGMSSPAAAKLPDNLMVLQGAMKCCLQDDAGEVQYYTDPTNRALKENGDVSVLTGADGQVMVETPLAWLKYWYENSQHHWMISKEQFNGAARLDAFYKNDEWVKNRYMAAYEGVLYDDSALKYTNGVQQPAHNVGFIAGTKTIIHRTGTVKTVDMAGAAAGSGYTVNDVLTLVGGTTGATVTVATIDGGGGVLTITLTTKGYGHSTGIVATSGGTGTNCTINIASLETAMTHPYTKLEAGDKVAIASTSNNNTTFTVNTPGDQSFTVDEVVTAEDYASGCVLETQKDWNNDELSSVSGKAPINYGTRDHFRTAAASRGAPGSGWRQQDYDLVSAIQLFYLVEYASWHSQSMIGAGLTNFGGTNWLNRSKHNPIELTGLSNSIGNASGSVDNGANALGSYMSYRGIENFFGHLWKWVDGINIGGAVLPDDNNKVHVCNNDERFADNTWANYTDLGIVLAQGNGWQKTLERISRGFLPASILGGSATYITDYYYQNTGGRVAALGGAADDGSYAGAACWALNYSSGSRNRAIVGRLCR